MYILVVAMLALVALMHSSLRTSSVVELRNRVRLAADRKLREIEHWAWSREAGMRNFDTNPEDWAGSWGRVGTFSDALDPDLSFTVRVAAVDLHSPSRSLETVAGASQRVISRAVRRVTVEVSAPRGAARSSLTTLIGEGPDREWAATESLRIETVGSFPNPLPPDEGATFRVRAYDRDGREIPGMLFRWYLRPLDGNGTVTQTRDGRQATFRNVYFRANGSRTHTGGRCRLMVRAVLNGVERTAQTPAIALLK